MRQRKRSEESGFVLGLSTERLFIYFLLFFASFFIAITSNIDQ